MNVLNPTLFDALKARFGKVRVSNQGVKGTLIDSPTGRSYYRGGEHYRVCCPACGDERFRLYINWAFGTFDSAGRVIDRAFNCFNENCQRNGFSLHDELQMYLQGGTTPALTATDVSGAPIDETFIRTPGRCQLIDQLPAEHPIRVYLQQRRFDPDRLASVYGFSICLEAHPWVSTYMQTNLPGRLVIPITHAGQPIGWQARYVGDVPKTDRKIPKYLTAPGFRKSTCLYNFDAAIAARSRLGIVVEGVFDALRLPCAVACFGHQLSLDQRELLYKQYGEGGVILLFDADVRETTQRQCTEMSTMCRYGVTAIELPDERDPADWDSDELLRYIVWSAASAGFPIHDLLKF